MAEFQLTVVNYRPTTKPGALKARLTLQDQNGVQVTDCAHFVRKADDTEWIAPPARPLPLPQGASQETKPVYVDLIGFATPQLKRSWQAAALRAVREHLANNVQPDEDEWRYDDRDRRHQ